MRRLPILLLFLLALPAASYAQKFYGGLDFSRNDLLPMEGLVDCWEFDQNTLEGNLLGDVGSLEVWDGGHFECTNCPTSTGDAFVECRCLGGADLDAEGVAVATGSSSIELSSGTSGAASFSVHLAQPLEANATYQVEWFDRGDGGASTEDYFVEIYRETPAGPNLLVDGNAEYTGVGVWTVASAGEVFEKRFDVRPGSPGARANYQESTGTSSYQHYQSILTNNTYYRFSGWRKNNAGGPYVGVSGMGRIVEANESPQWAYQESVFSAGPTGLNFLLASTNGSDGTYSYTDDLVVEAVPSREDYDIEGDVWVPNDNILTDPNMEEAVVADWTSFNATPSYEVGEAYASQGAQVLRVTGTLNQYVTSNYSPVLGKTYRMTGWARGDGTAFPRFSDSGFSTWEGTSSTTWQYFDIVWTQAGSTFRLVIKGGDGHIEFDNLTLREFHGRKVSDVPRSWFNKGFLVQNGSTPSENVVLKFTAAHSNGASQVLHVDDIRVRKFKGGKSLVSMRGAQTRIRNDPFIGGGPRRKNGSEGNYGLRKNTRDPNDQTSAFIQKDPWQGEWYGNTFSLGYDIYGLEVVAQDVFSSDRDAPSDTSFIFYTSNGSDTLVLLTRDGSTSGPFSVLQKVSTYSDRSMNRSVFTYEFAGDTTSLGTAQVNGLSARSYSTLIGPAYRSNQGVSIGGYSDNATPTASANLEFNRFCVWDRALEETDRNRFIHPHTVQAPGMGTEIAMKSCDNISPVANCGLTGCTNGGVSLCNANQAGFLPFFGQQTELLQSNSFESVTETGSSVTADVFTDWNIVRNPITNIVKRSSDAFHGESSVRLSSSAGTNHYAIVESACVDVSPSTTYWVESVVKMLEGSPLNLRIQSREYDQDDCSVSGTLVTQKSMVVAATLQDQVKKGSWSRVGGAFETEATTESLFYWFSVTPNATGATGEHTEVLLDSVSLKENTYSTPWFENPGSAGGVTTVTNTSAFSSYENPLGVKSNESDEDLPIDDGLCISLWVYTPWGVGETTANRYLVSTVDASSSRIVLAYFTTDRLLLDVVSASQERYKFSEVFTDADFSSEGWKYIQGCSDNAGDIDLTLYDKNTETWKSSSTGLAGTGDGIMTDVGDLMLGHITFSPDVYFYKVWLTKPTFIGGSMILDRYGFEDQPTHKPY